MVDIQTYLDLITFYRAEFMHAITSMTKERWVRLGDYMSVDLLVMITQRETRPNVQTCALVHSHCCNPAEGVSVLHLSVLRQAAPCRSECMEQQSCFLCGWGERERQRGLGPTSLFQGMPPVDWEPPARLYTPPLQCHNWGLSLSYMNLWGTFKVRDIVAFLCILP